MTLSPDHFLEQWVSQLGAALPVGDVPGCLDTASDHLRMLPSYVDVLNDAQVDYVDASVPKGYGNHLVSDGVDEKFHVRAMVLAPGHVTPIHDHAVWCCLICVKGAVTEHFYTASTDSQPSATLKDSRTLLVGQVSKANPAGPNIHALENRSDATAITIHVYGGPVAPSAETIYDQP